jgi:hypothetical protein
LVCWEIGWMSSTYIYNAWFFLLCASIKSASSCLIDTSTAWAETPTFFFSSAWTSFHWNATYINTHTPFEVKLDVYFIHHGHCLKISKSVFFLNLWQKEITKLNWDVRGSWNLRLARVVEAFRVSFLYHQTCRPGFPEVFGLVMTCYA